MAVYTYFGLCMGALSVWYVWRWNTAGVLVSVCIHTQYLRFTNKLHRIAETLELPTAYDIYKSESPDGITYNSYLIAVLEHKEAALQHVIEYTENILYRHLRLIAIVSIPGFLLCLGALPAFFAGMFLYGTLNYLFPYIRIIRTNEPLLTLKLLTDDVLSRNTPQQND